MAVNIHRNIFGMPSIRGLGGGIFLLACVWGFEGHAETVTRYVRYGFTLRNETDRVVPVAELWVCAPVRDMPTQRLVDLRTTPVGEEREDSLGNHLVRFVYNNVPPYAVRTAVVEATLEMSPEPRPEADPGTAFSASEPLLEYDSDAFVQQAPVLAAGAADAVARQIHDWIRENVSADGYDAVDRGSVYALTARTGDCTEFAALFVALCRRAGIPARLLGGYVVERDSLLKAEAYHNWAEFHAGGTWRMADPHAGVFDAHREGYVATRMLGESDSPLGNSARFRVVGEGVRAVMDP